MTYKAVLRVRNAIDVNHGWSTVTDLPLGRYDSDDGEFTVLERTDDDSGLYYIVDMHKQGFDLQQEPYEYLVLYARPLGLVTKKPEEETPIVSFMPNRAFVKEVVDQFRLYLKSKPVDDVFVPVVDSLEKWLKAAAQ